MAPFPRIFSTIDDLNASRGTKIVELLKGVANKGAGIHPNNRSLGGMSFIIGVSDSPQIGNEFRSWRFKTYVDGFHCMYHEVWIPYEKDMYFLERAYFHLYKTSQDRFGTEEEYILLHCDVSEPDDAPHAKYKQSPHLHIQSAEQPLPHAHFALNNCDLVNTLSTLENLNSAMTNAINMIDEQILFQLAGLKP